LTGGSPTSLAAFHQLASKISAACLAISFILRLTHRFPDKSSWGTSSERDQTCRGLRHPTRCLQLRQRQHLVA
jgi:hypothetical protein